MTASPYEGTVPEFTQGDRLRKAREMTGMKQREFASHIGVSHQTVTNAEKDHREVRKITMNAWSLATGVSVEWLQTGKAPESTNGPGGGADDRTRTGNILLGIPKATPRRLRSAA